MPGNGSWLTDLLPHIRLLVSNPNFFSKGIGLAVPIVLAGTVKYTCIQYIQKYTVLIKMNPLLKVPMCCCFTTLKQSRFNIFGALVKTKSSLNRRQRNTGQGKCPTEYKITWTEFSCVNHWVMERKWHSYKSAENRLSSKNWVSEHEGGHQEISAKSEGDPSYRVSD